MTGPGDGKADHRLLPTDKEQRTVTFPDRTRRVLTMEHWFWDALDEIAGREGMKTAELIRRTDLRRGSMPLVPALRLLCLTYFRPSATAPGNLAAALDAAAGPSPAPGVC